MLRYIIVRAPPRSEKMSFKKIICISADIFNVVFMRTFMFHVCIDMTQMTTGKQEEFACIP